MTPCSNSNPCRSPSDEADCGYSEDDSMRGSIVGTPTATPQGGGTPSITQLKGVFPPLLRLFRRYPSLLGYWRRLRQPNVLSLWERIKSIRSAAPIIIQGNAILLSRVLPITQGGLIISINPSREVGTVVVPIRVRERGIRRQTSNANRSTERLVYRSKLKRLFRVGPNSLSIRRGQYIDLPVFLLNSAWVL